jgi:hypothetical protein
MIILTPDEIFKLKKVTDLIDLKCEQCGSTFQSEKRNAQKVLKHISIKGYKQNWLKFCNHSCATSYNNDHKTTGSNRSKLEKWLEQQLTILYPNLEIHYNLRNSINAELDIYIPSLKLAFELNGIFHYEPIFGEDRLLSAKTNDERKFQACLEHGIELCIIDTSKLNGSIKNTKKIQPFLDIVTNLIALKLVGPDGTAPSPIG